jgi:hypothetical protein
VDRLAGSDLLACDHDRDGRAGAFLDRVNTALHLRRREPARRKRKGQQQDRAAAR